MKVKGLTCILVFLLGSVGMLRAAEPSVTIFFESYADEYLEKAVQW